MPNPYFQFKQFTIYQDKCAMKVGTDGVLLGAWTDITEADTILDIGTGTGLVTLMIAQRTNSKPSIDSIDIDKEATKQAKDNVEKSGFSNIRCFDSSLQEYAPFCDEKYDIIVSNPPYFSLSLHSPDQQRTLARHTNSLSMEELFDLSIPLLSNKGRISIIYPYSEKGALCNLAENRGLYTMRFTTVYPRYNSLPKRILMEFSVQKQETQTNDLTIEIERHIYSPEFISLTKDFYLKL